MSGSPPRWATRRPPSWPPRPHRPPLSERAATSAPRPRCRSAGTRRSPRRRPGRRATASALVFATRPGPTIPVGHVPDGRPGDPHQRGPPRRGGDRRRRSSTAAGRAGLGGEDLDPAVEAAVAYGGAHTSSWPARTPRAPGRRSPRRLRRPPATSCAERGLTSPVALVWREDETTVHARNPFPVGGVVEDPATGRGGRGARRLPARPRRGRRPRRITIRQGEDMGRPSELLVDVRPDDPRVTVTGTATVIPG